MPKSNDESATMEQENQASGQLPPNKRHRGRSVSVGQDPSNNDILVAMSKFNKDVMDTIKLKNDEIKLAMDKMHKNILKYVDDTKKNLEEQIDKVKSEVMTEVQVANQKSADCIAGMEKMSKSIETRIDKLERQSLLNEVIVTGIPHQGGENIIQIVDSICRVIDFNPEKEIESCFRIPAKKGHNKDTPIVMKFWTIESKRAFMNKYFNAKSLNLTQIGFKTAARRVYINESLTLKNRDIFSMAQRLKREKKISLVRIRSGLVYVTLAGQSTFVSIISRDQLASL